MTTSKIAIKNLYVFYTTKVWGNYKMG